MHNIIRLSFLSQSGCLCVNGVNIKDQPFRYNPFNCSGSKRRLHGSYITTSRMNVMSPRSHVIFITELFQTILNGNDNLFKNVKIDKQVQLCSF